MARSNVRQNVVNRFELQPRSGERSYDSLLQPRSGERSYDSLFFQISNTSQHEEVGGGP